MAGRYTGSYLDRLEGWRAWATLADIGQASLVERIPQGVTYDFTRRATTGLEWNRVAQTRESARP